MAAAVGIALFAAICVSRATAANPSAATALSAPSPTLRLTLSTGWISARITALPGARLELLESVSGHLDPIAALSAPSDGTLTLPHAAQWLCGRRTRTFKLQAIASPYAPPRSATITTPSCARRLTLAAPAYAPVGDRIQIAVTDTWGTGSLPFELCIGPPASITTCHNQALPAGLRSIRISATVESPGQWYVTLRTQFGQRAVRVVSVAHPGGYLRLLATGDSEIQYIDQDLAGALAPRRVQVTSDARVGSGISKVSLFDWVRHAAYQASTIRPDITVVFIGANDGFALQNPAGDWIPCCNATWIDLFAQRTERMMSSYLQAGRGRVYWFALPIARNAAYAAVFTAVNRAYLLAAAHYPDGVHLIRADQIFTPGGRYTQTIKYRGRLVNVRAPDGIHLSAAGASIATAAVLAALQHGHLIA
ncbi:MAG: hypothetical protein ACLP8S_15945 [Solirubrobacteraceae bacterium]